MCSASQAKRVERYPSSLSHQRGGSVSSQPRVGWCQRPGQSAVACGQTAECEWRSGAAERRPAQRWPNTHTQTITHTLTNKQTNRPRPEAAGSSQTTLSQTATRWPSTKTSLNLPGRNLSDFSHVHVETLTTRQLNLRDVVVASVNYQVATDS